jgi:hypothetical protein
MSLADYTALKAAIASDWLHRADLTTATPDFIALFESDFNSEMRVRQMEQETTIASTTGYLVHPTSWLSWKEIRGTSAGITYELETVPDEVAVMRTAGDGGVSRMFKVKGTKTYLYPSTGGSFPTTYYEGVALTGGTNWLLTRYPGAYLYGSLLQAVASIGDDGRVPLWKAAYDGILDRIKADSRKGEWGRQLRMGHDTPIV